MPKNKKKIGKETEVKKGKPSDGQDITQKQIDKLAAKIYGETGSLRPQFKKGTKEYDSKSEEDLHNTRKEVGHISENGGKLGSPKKPTKEELKNPHVEREWKKSQKAAKEVLEERRKKIDPTNGAKHFYIRKGEKKDNKGNIEDRPWYLEDDKDGVSPKPSKSRGPFRNLGGGDVGKGNNIFIDVYKETKKREEKKNKGDGSKGSGSGG